MRSPQNNPPVPRADCFCSRLPLAANGAPGRYMTSAASVGAPMGIYDYDRRGRQHPFAASAVAWGGKAFRPDAVINVQPVSTVAFLNMDVSRAEAKLEIQAQEDPPAEEAAPLPDSFGHDDARPNDKALRQLAQNREAAQKNRLRKKAYIQTLESSRMKLAQMEQELTRIRRQQGVFVSGRTGEFLLWGYHHLSLIQAPPRSSLPPQSATTFWHRSSTLPLPD